MDSDEALSISDSDDPPIGIIASEGQAGTRWGRLPQGTLFVAESKKDRGIGQHKDTHDSAAHDTENVLHTPIHQCGVPSAPVVVPSRPVKVKPAVSVIEFIKTKSVIMFFSEVICAVTLKHCV